MGFCFFILFFFFPSFLLFLSFSYLKQLKRFCQISCQPNLLNKVMALKTPKKTKMINIITRRHILGRKIFGKAVWFKRLTKPICTNIATALIIAPITIKVFGSQIFNKKRITPKAICDQTKIKYILERLIFSFFIFKAIFSAMILEVESITPN